MEGPSAPGWDRWKSAPQYRDGVARSSGLERVELRNLKVHLSPKVMGPGTGGSRGSRPSNFETGGETPPSFDR